MKYEYFINICQDLSDERKLGHCIQLKTISNLQKKRESCIIGDH